MIRVIGAITRNALSVDSGLSASKALFHLFSPQSDEMDTVLSVLHMEKLKIERPHDGPMVTQQGVDEVEFTTKFV